MYTTAVSFKNCSVLTAMFQSTKGIADSKLEVSWDFFERSKVGRWDMYGFVGFAK